MECAQSTLLLAHVLFSLFQDIEKARKTQIHGAISQSSKSVHKCSYLDVGQAKVRSLQLSSGHPAERQHSSAGAIPRCLQYIRALTELTEHSSNKGCMHLKHPMSTLFSFSYVCVCVCMILKLAVSKAALEFPESKHLWTVHLETLVL